MYQGPTATRQFDTVTVSVVTVDGDPDRLAFYDGTSRQSWLAMDDPLDLRDYR